MRNSAAAQIDANGRAFEKLVALVERRVAAGRLSSAAAWIRVAAAFATTNPHGALRDVRLDRALDAISRVTLPDPGTGARRRRGRRRILHVLSEAQMIGGHLRMVQRWVESDDESISSVVVTRPRCESPALSALVRQRGGTAAVLEPSTLLARARLLRAASETADVVVCHSHADDPVPAIAFGGEYAGPPVVMVNHADHVFGLGVGNLSVLVSQREIAAEAAVTARGYPRSCQLVSPLPLPGVSRARDRAEAKRCLGLDESSLVALTLARPVKYASAPWHPGFTEVMGPALEGAPEVILVAVGPDAGDPAWHSLRDAFPGRVLVPGLQADPSVYLDAADIYLDSFPFASITSTLEAAARGVPVLASRKYSGMEKLMSGAGPLDDVVLGGADTEAYLAQFWNLAGDPELRARAGRAAADAVRERHGAEAWATRLERIYDRAADATPVRTRSRPTADPCELVAYAEALIGIEAQAPLLWTIGFCREDFDAADRWSSLARGLSVRVAQKLTGSGAGSDPRASAFLIPMRGLS